MKTERERKLEAALNEIHNWLVCAAIASPDDMAQSFPAMEQMAREALAMSESGPSGGAKDAERYRWLNDVGATFYVDEQRYHVAEQAMDDAIDAALQRSDNGKGVSDDAASAAVNKDQP